MAADEPARVPPEEIVRRFHRMYYRLGTRTWANTRWLGVQTLKCPLDLWVYQEIIYETRPDVIIECGTAMGGSAHFFACLCDVMGYREGPGSGRVITIDKEERADRPHHPRITYLTGSTLAPEIVETVRQSVRDEDRVMVVLDSDHTKDHVLAELRIYGPLVTLGNYLIVEDTNLNGHPVEREFGPGPMEAVEEFLASQDGFAVDSSREKFLLTFNPGGFLERVG
jgi:cephalosporin hydroxylase